MHWWPHWNLRMETFFGAKVIRKWVLHQVCVLRENRGKNTVLLGASAHGYLTSNQIEHLDKMFKINSNCSFLPALEKWKNINPEFRHSFFVGSNSSHRTNHISCHSAFKRHLLENIKCNLPESESDFWIPVISTTWNPKQLRGFAWSPPNG